MNPVAVRLAAGRPTDMTVTIILKLIDTLSDVQLDALADQLPEQITDRVLSQADKGQDFYEGCIGKIAEIELGHMLTDAEIDALWDQKVAEGERALTDAWFGEGNDL